MRTENIQMMGNTKIGRLLYETHGNPIKISPTSLTDESGTLVEVNVDELCNAINEEYLTPIKYKLVQNTLSIMIENKEIPDHTYDLLTLYVFRNRSSLSSCLYDLWPLYISEETSFILNKKYPIDKLPIMEETASHIISFIGQESRTKQGRFTKRFSTYMWKVHQIKMTDVEITRIGNLYNAHRLLNREYIIRVINNFTWKDGQFGKGDSCWWSCYKNSRYTLYYYGGYGVLFYPTDCVDFDDDDGIGRVWVYPVDDTLAITFNSYGNEPKVAAAVVAKLLENLTGKTHYYGKRYVHNDEDSNCPYINGDNGHNNDGGSKCFAIYSENKPEDTITICMQEKAGYFSNIRTCHSCGDEYSEDSMQEDSGGYWYCSECYNERYTSCGRCGDEIRRDYTRSFENNDNDYCESCFDYLFSFVCYSCEESFDDNENETIDVDENSYCENCASRCLTHCEQHDIYYTSDACPECEEESEREE